MTTRSRDAVSRVIRLDDIIDVEPMVEEQACALLRKRLGENILCDQAELCEISERLDYMPLALAQAASYIRQRAPRSSVHRYLEKLDESGRSELRLLSRDDGDSRRDRDAKNSVLLTWQISFEHIRQIRSTAADLLSRMSFFDRQTIPEELLHSRQAVSTAMVVHDGREHEDQNEDALDASDSASESGSDIFDDDIQLLRSYAFIALTADPSAFEMHRLVQLATQQWLKVNNLLERWGSHFVRILDDSFPGSNPSTLTLCRILYPHAVMALGTKLTEQDAVLRQISLLNKSGYHACCLGAYADAESMVKHALDAQTTLSGRDVDQTLRSIQILGRIYRFQLRLDEAERLLQDCFPLAQRTSESWHMILMAEMAKIYASTGRLLEAERLQLACQELCQKLYDEESDMMVELMIAMSIIYRRLERYEEAEALLVRVLNLKTKADRAEAWASRVATNCLAKVYYQTGNLAEAEKLEIQALGASRSEFGYNHPVTLTAMENLSHILQRLGQLTSAVNLMGDCANMSLQTLGPDHPRTRYRYEWYEDWKRRDREAQIVLPDNSGT